MPTGYTAALYDREQSFEDFVKGAALGMAICHYRGLVTDAEPSEYHLEAEERAAKRLAELTEMSEQDKEAAFDKDRSSFEEEVAQSRARSLLRLTRLVEMRLKVARWTPPTPDHEPLKEFMLSQLDMTIQPEERSYRSEWQFDSVEQWFEAKVESALREIKYHRNEYQREVENTTAANRWVTALLADMD